MESGKEKNCHLSLNNGLFRILGKGIFWLMANFAYFCTLKKAEENRFNHSNSKNHDNCRPT
jgi:hypothetical protein